VLLAAARRFVVLLGVITVGVAVVASLLGLLFGSSLHRAVSLGFYLVGSFLLIAGFFLGNRGPTRLKGSPGAEGPWGIGTKRRVRWATPEERDAAINDSAILVALGFALIIVGVAADDRHSLL
jgi:hypothetical protein